MSSSRPSHETGGVVAGDPRLRYLAIAALAAVVIGARLKLDNQALNARLQLAEQTNAAAEGRERELARAVAAKHRDLQAAETELNATRWRMDAVELQLDGVDKLSREVREELGLPAGSGTWGEALPLGTPQGGPGAALGVADRVELARRRLSQGLAELTLLSSSARERNAAPVTAPAVAAAAVVQPYAWPLRGEVTSDYGWRIFRGKPEYHTGIDVAAAYGSLALATAPGTVVGSGWQPGYGWCVLVQHAGGFHTLYAHLSALKVHTGDVVPMDAVVGLVGSSGRSTGPHLHYEIWKNGALQNPLDYLKGSADR